MNYLSNVFYRNNYEQPLVLASSELSREDYYSQDKDESLSDDVEKRVENASKDKFYPKSSPLLITSSDNVGLDYLPPVKGEVLPYDIMRTFARQNLTLLNTIGGLSKKHGDIAKCEVINLSNTIDFSNLKIDTLKDIHSLTRFLTNVKCEKIEKIIFPINLVDKLKPNILDRVAQTFPNIKEFSVVNKDKDHQDIEIVDNTKFDFIRFWPLLESIDLSGQDIITEIQWVKWAPQLKSFNASGCKFKFLFYLEELKNLTKLDLSGCYCADLNFILLMNLEYLNLSGCMDISDFDKISQLTNLKSLNLSGTRCDYVEHLKSLNKLEELDLSDLVYYEINVEDLKFLKNLKKLNLQGIELDDHPLFLGELPNLEHLAIDLCESNKITLPSMPKLKSLDLSFANFNEIEFEKPLDNLVKIKMLYCKFQNLDFLELMPNLEEVDLRSNKNLESLGPCLNLKELRRLNLQKYMNVKAPKTSEWKCENLRELNLKDCDWVQDLDFLGKLPNLYAINLEKLELPFSAEMNLNKFPKLKLIKYDWC